MFCFIVWKWERWKSTHRIASSKSWNKRLQCYNWWENPFWLASKNDLKTYENVWKMATGQGDDYRTSCLLDYDYFKEYYKPIAIDLSKQQALE